MATWLVLLALPIAPRAAFGAPVQPSAAAVQAFDEFRARHGEGWEILWNDGTGYGRFLSGSSAAAPPVAPRSSKDFVAMTQRLLRENRALFGVEPSQLSVKSVNHSPLSKAGTTDKVGVEMVQSVDGVEVYGASLVALFLPDGRLTAVDAQVLPIPEGLRVTPRTPATRAAEVAAAQLTSAFGATADEVTPPRLVVYPHESGSRTTPRLAWLVEARSSARLEPGAPRQWMYVVSADDDSAEVLDAWDQVHADSISGTVKGWAVPGLEPTFGSELLVPLGRLKVTTREEYPGNHTIYTYTNNPSGLFMFTERTHNAAVTARLEGSLVNVDDDEGTDESATATFVLDVPGTLTLNPFRTVSATAEVNVFRWVNHFRNYVLAVDPSYSLMGDVTVKANVNQDHSCNAFYNGSSINFYRAGDGCVNMAYSTVIVHEEGHWANHKAGTGNDKISGMGEGAADVWALYVANTINGNTDDPFVGRGWKGPTTKLRTGENTRQFCGDDDPGCYPEEHDGGEVLMGAFWKMRARLKSTNGAAAGNDIANTLWIAWNKQYNQTKIKSVIVTQILTLDDDDGNLDNGTPHFHDIRAAFQAQGFPVLWWPFPL